MHSITPNASTDTPQPAPSSISLPFRNKQDGGRIHCPRCVGELEPITYEGVDLDVCLLCRGLWFDQGELAKFNNFDSDFPLGPGKPVKGKAIGGHCPRCSVVMNVTRYAPGTKFQVDRCADCGGVWLDNGEIGKVQQLLTDEVKLWLKIGNRLDEVILRERTLWENYNAELAKHEAATKISPAQWLFLFLTRLPREVYNPVHCIPKVTIGLIVANVLVFLLMSQLFDRRNPSALPTELWFCSGAVRSYAASLDCSDFAVYSRKRGSCSGQHVFPLHLRG